MTDRIVNVRHIHLVRQRSATGGAAAQVDLRPWLVRAVLLLAAALAALVLLGTPAHADDDTGSASADSSSSSSSADSSSSSSSAESSSSSSTDGKKAESSSSKHVSATKSRTTRTRSTAPRVPARIRSSASKSTAVVWKHPKAHRSVPKTVAKESSDKQDSDEHATKDDDSSDDTKASGSSSDDTTSSDSGSDDSKASDSSGDDKPSTSGGTPVASDPGTSGGGSGNGHDAGGSDDSSTTPDPGNGDNGGTTTPDPGNGDNGGTTTPDPGTGTGVTTPDPGTPVVVDPGPENPVVVLPPVLGEPVSHTPSKAHSDEPQPAQLATSLNIPMLVASGDAEAARIATITADASSAVSQPAAAPGTTHATTVDPETGDVVVVIPEHMHDSASAPVGLSASGSPHNSTTVAAGASGSVTCGGASASVLGLLESVFGLGADRSGSFGPLANVQDYAWRMPRQPGFAPD